MSTIEKRLQKALKTAPILPLEQNSKYIIMSDCHRGQGNTGDNFLPNQSIFFGALEYYYHQNFTYIELGDGDELWENRNMDLIKEVHSDTFNLMAKFYQKHRFYMIYGNHDMVKGKRNCFKTYCESYYSDLMHKQMPLFPHMKIYESIILQNFKTHQKIYLLHGHQADPFNDTFWRLSRFLVRYVWKPFELIGFHAPTGAGRAHTKKEQIEKKLADFAKTQKTLLIAGHTHRPAVSYPSPDTGYYFNDGSCVHPHCISGIEIQDNQISLIKWAEATKEDQTLYIKRSLLAGPFSLTEYL